MKIRNTLFLIAALVTGLYFSGCTEENGPNGGGNYGKPSGLQVTSISGTSIGARWTRASDDVGMDTLVAVPVGGGTEVKAVTSGSSTTIGGLSPNVKYNLSVSAEGSAGRTASVEWATATRSAALRLYETADNTTGHYSGLVLGPTPHTASTIGAEKLDIDLVLATDNSLTLPFLSLQGADVAGSGIPGGRATRMGNSYFIVAAGLDGDYYSTGFSGEFSNGVNYFPVLGTTSNPIVILVKTADNPAHYARVQVVPQNNGFLWGDTPGTPSYRYIDVYVSYQTIAGVAYAGRPIGVTRGFNAPKVGGANAVVKN